MSVSPPMCFECVEFDGSSGDGEGGLTCTAFPEGIPNEIITSQADHRRPFAGDSGIQFKATNPDIGEVGLASQNPLLLQSVEPVLGLLRRPRKTRLPFDL